jgi:hypothetical protein
MTSSTEIAVPLARPIRITLPRVSAAAQYRIICVVMGIALVGGGAIVLRALAVAKEAVLF